MDLSECSSLTHLGSFAFSGCATLRWIGTRSVAGLGLVVPGYPLVSVGLRVKGLTWHKPHIPNPHLLAQPVHLGVDATVQDGGQLVKPQGPR